MIFQLFLAIIITQRFIELFIAKRNEKWMKANGAIEVGQEHYKYIVLLHFLFFISFLIEVSHYDNNISPIWPAFLALFALTQILRVWCMKSLGRFWNTKILIMPNVAVISSGPYKYIKHPNYLVVALELFIIPLFFQAYITAFTFSLLNTVMMLIRIPSEEKALMKQTNYRQVFSTRSKLAAEKTPK